MISLRELQLGFSEDVFSGGGTGFDAQIKANGLSGERRLQIYRNNTFASLTDALQKTYPVIFQLVGDGFFRYAAARYLGQYPSTSGDLHDFGGTFPAFLRTFEPAAELVYLADLADLEYACEQVFYAADHAPLDPLAMAEVPAARYGDLTFTLHPASRLLASAYPILHIWQVNQENYNGDPGVDLREGGVKLLVLRPHLEVEIQPLSAGEFALLHALADSRDFTTACEQALDAQPDFDVAAGFRRHILQGTLISFAF